LKNKIFSFFSLFFTESRLVSSKPENQGVPKALAKKHSTSTSQMMKQKQQLTAGRYPTAAGPLQRLEPAPLALSSGYNRYHWDLMKTDLYNAFLSNVTVITHIKLIRVCDFCQNEE
jgi:hypothetical protein